MADSCHLAHSDHRLSAQSNIGATVGARAPTGVRWGYRARDEAAVGDAFASGPRCGTVLDCADVSRRNPGTRRA
jgi:hypothetical protein